MSTTPNDVAQNRNSTLAAETSAGRSDGKVTVRNTWAGVAPSAAAASPGLGSSDSQVVPTARITTATLKKVRPAMIATGVPSRPRKPSGPDSPTSSRNATPTTTVGSTNGTSSSARMTLRKGKSSRCRTYAAGRPSTTEQTVASPADQTVNHSTRWVRDRPRTSRTAPASKWPSTTKPRPIIPLTGSTKKTASTSTGPRERPARVSSRRLTGW